MVLAHRDACTLATRVYTLPGVSTHRRNRSGGTAPGTLHFNQSADSFAGQIGRPQPLRHQPFELQFLGVVE
jgi:hypothetical protein